MTETLSGFVTQVVSIPVGLVGQDNITLIMLAGAVIGLGAYLWGRFGRKGK